jgi:hypothetical protein
VPGGNVTVPVGRQVGGDFAHIPACRSTRQAGCVVGYSSFDAPPPADSRFGRVGGSLNPFAPTQPNTHVLCVNPAAPAGGAGALVPYFPAPASSGAPWVTYPDEYRARCRTGGGAT